MTFIQVVQLLAALQLTLFCVYSSPVGFLDNLVFKLTPTLLAFILLAISLKQYL